jgi:hypothetical protein
LFLFLPFLNGERIEASGGLMKTLALGLVLILPSVVTAKQREWKNATVAAIAAGSADNDAAVMPVGTVCLGVRITTDCIQEGYKVAAVVEVKKEIPVRLLTFLYYCIFLHPVIRL